ncbi:MAG TPA: hypothetical protein DEP28_08090, partial [Bacteroidetes bacterium]|nr:hypothetical protein [Bacteroidota bacterium]
METNLNFVIMKILAFLLFNTGINFTYATINISVCNNNLFTKPYTFEVFDTLLIYSEFNKNFVYFYSLERELVFDSIKVNDSNNILFFSSSPTDIILNTYSLNFSNSTFFNEY